MFTSTANNRQENLGHLEQSEPSAETGMSILNREISDSMGLPSCYIFRGFWIELSMSYKKYQSSCGSEKPLWEALIHSPTQTKTVISVGSYRTRLEAALKAEKIILSWRS